MAQGDITVEVVNNATAAAVDTAMTALYVTANDKWSVITLGRNDVMIIHIEEV